MIPDGWTRFGEILALIMVIMGLATFWLIGRRILFWQFHHEEVRDAHLSTLRTIERINQITAATHGALWRALRDHDCDRSS